MTVSGYARYYFDIADRGLIIADYQGHEHLDLDAAIAEAIQASEDFEASHDLAIHLRQGGVVVAVIDAREARVLTG